MFHDVRIDELIEANPTLEQHMRDWQTARHQRGENPFDWESFRTVMAFVGARDPGDEAPSEFYWFTPPVGSAVAVLASAGDRSAAPSARLASPGRDGASSLTEVKYWR